MSFLLSRTNKRSLKRLRRPHFSAAQVAVPLFYMLINFWQVAEILILKIKIKAILMALIFIDNIRISPQQRTFFPVVLFILLKKVVLTYESAGEILTVWPFNWKLQSSSFPCMWFCFIELYFVQSDCNFSLECWSWSLEQLKNAADEY